jgi:hypothetical protein
MVWKMVMMVWLQVNKLFEDYIYAAIEYAILGSKVGVQEYIVARLKKEKCSTIEKCKN